MKHNELLLLLCKKTTNLQCLCEAQKVRVVIELFLLFCFVNWTLIGKTQLESRKSIYILKRRNIKAEFTKNDLYSVAVFGKDRKYRCPVTASSHKVHASPYLFSMAVLL